MSSYQYRITVAALPSEHQPADRLPSTFSFETSTHDDLTRVMQVVRSAEIVEADEADPFALGMKLFAETVLRHRKDPRFEEFEAPLRRFIGALKPGKTGH